MSREELRQHWRLKVEALKSSGLSVSRFSREQDLNYAQLLRWSKQFTVAEDSSESTSIFDELASSSRLTLSSGSLELEVECGIDFNSLVQVIGALCQAAKLRR